MRRKKEEGGWHWLSKGFFYLCQLYGHRLSFSLSLSLTLSLYGNVPNQQNMIASYISRHTESISEPHGTGEQEYFHYIAHNSSLFEIESEIQ